MVQASDDSHAFHVYHGHVVSPRVKQLMQIQITVSAAYAPRSYSDTVSCIKFFVLGYI